MIILSARDVLNRVRNAGLKLNKEKCQFNQTKLEFLGHIIAENGIEISPNKIYAILKLKTLGNVSELRRVLGLVNFVTKFIPNAQTNLTPLNELLKKGVCWQWSNDRQRAFNEIKQSLCRAPALAYFDPNKDTLVSADSSAYAMGGVLLQRHGKIVRPLAYCSRSLLPSEKNYAPIEKEVLASVWVCEKFHIYIHSDR